MTSDVPGPPGVELRDGVVGDADPLSSLFLRARKTAMPWLHSPHDDETRWWMEHVVLAGQPVRVAVDGTRVLGFAVVEGDRLDHLYVDPAEQGRGVGRLLVAQAMAGRERLLLYVFTRNLRARRFYEAAGFVLTAESDGSGNEEREPDCTYTWPGVAPTR